MSGFATKSWVIRYEPNPHARFRLFCLPYAGGGPHIFCGWSEGLPKEVEVCPIQLPGRGSRIKETPFTNLVQLVGHLAQGLLPLMDKPFAFFGHSMGALISFELARQLRRERRVGPAVLFVASRRAPQLPQSSPQMHRLSDAGFIQALRFLGGMPEALFNQPELLQLVLPILRADVTLVETYVYQHEDPLDCPISAFAGKLGTDVSRYELESWRKQTSQSFNLEMFPSNHFFLIDDRALLLQAITRDLLSTLRL
jgi:medium-chain acyl-[acyl-carrier-protein] hydrolase